MIDKICIKCNCSKQNIFFPIAHFMCIFIFPEIRQLDFELPILYSVSISHKQYNTNKSIVKTKQSFINPARHVHASSLFHKSHIIT